MLVTGMFPGDLAHVLKAVQLCQSWLYVIDEIMLPTPGPISAIPNLDLDRILQEASGVLSAGCSSHAPVATNNTSRMGGSSGTGFLTPGYGQSSAAAQVPQAPTTSASPGTGFLTPGYGSSTAVPAPYTSPPPPVRLESSSCTLQTCFPFRMRYHFCLACPAGGRYFVTLCALILYSPSTTRQYVV